MGLLAGTVGVAAALADLGQPGMRLRALAVGSHRRLI